MMIPLLWDVTLCHHLSPNNMAHNTLNVRPSHVLSLHADWSCLRLWYCQLTCQDTWKVASSLSTILAVNCKFWKIIRAKCAVNFFVLGCYMLHRLINLKWVPWILCTVDCGRFNCHAPCLTAFLGCHNFSDWSFTGVFAFTNATSFIGQLMALSDGYFCWHIPTKLHTRSPLHCKHWFRFLILEHILCFLHLGCHFPQLWC